MHDDFKAKLGATLKDRRSKVLEIAQALASVQKFHHVTWRGELASAVAKELGAPEEFSKYVYQVMSNLAPLELAKIRVACIGEEAETLFYATRGDGRQGLFVKLEPSPRARKGMGRNEETDEQRAARIQQSIEKAIEGLPPDNRTPEALAGVLDWKLDRVKSYLFQRPEMARKLSPG